MNHRLHLRALALSLPLIAALSFASRDAHALGPVDIEVAGKVGGGSTPTNFGSPNPLGFGFGARGGVSAFGLYGGLQIMDYVGSSSMQTLNALSGSESRHAVQYGAEVGYGVKILMLKLRAQLGLGNFEQNGSVGGALANVGSFSLRGGSNSYFYLEPGIVGTMTFGLLLVGLDVNYLLLPSGPNYTSNNPSKSGSFDTSLTVHGQVGISF